MRLAMAAMAVAMIVSGQALAGPECLVGTWTGNLEGWKGKDGTGRKLVVRSAGADGSAVVLWGFAEGNAGPVSNVKVQGETVSFVTGPGGKVEASCKGDKVAGSYVWNSKPYFFSFTKQN